MNTEKLENIEQMTLEELVDTRLALKRLMESDGWEILMAYVRAQRESRERRAVRKVIATSEALAVHNFEQGEASYAGLLEGLPESLIEDFTQAIEHKERENGNQASAEE